MDTVGSKTFLVGGKSSQGQAQEVPAIVLGSRHHSGAVDIVVEQPDQEEEVVLPPGFAA